MRGVQLILYWKKTFFEKILYLELFEFVYNL